MLTPEVMKQKINEMTKSERSVAALFKNDPDFFLFSTLDETALRAAVSTTTVLRFCRRLGFSGFRAFQESLRGKVKMQPDLPDKFHRTVAEKNALLGRTVLRSVNSIRESFESISQEALVRATKKILTAKRVFTFGMKESFALAHYAYTRLFTVRPQVFLLDAVFRGEAEALMEPTPEDVCLFFLFHRYTKTSLRILEILRKKGVSVILVTNPPWEEVSSPETTVLPCQVDVGGIKNCAAAPVVLLDYLCSAVAVEGGESVLSHMEKAEEMFRMGDFLED